MKRKTVVVVAALSSVFAMSRLQAQATADAALIRGARKAQTAAMAVGDVERAATWWTDDIAIRRGLGVPVSGLAAYKAILERAPVSDTALV
jgi:hypothetical protein